MPTRPTPTGPRGNRAAIAILLACAACAANAQAPATPATPAPAADSQAAFTAADAGYKAYEKGDFEAAVREARRATQLAPANVQYARLLVSALAAAGRRAEAIEASGRVLALAPNDPQALLERGQLRAAGGDAAGARTDFEAALAAPGVQPVQRVTLLAELGRTEQARRELAQLQQAPGQPAPSDLEVAYLASRLGQPRQALAAFQRAEAAGKLPDAALRDAGFAAIGASEEAAAAAYFRRAVDAANAGRHKLSEQELFETRRAVSEVTRQAGVFASVNYRGGGGVTPGFGALPGTRIEEAWQGGVEAWWRPTGLNDGRYIELFARGFQTLATDDGPTGSESRQVGAGARVKPFSAHNLVLSASRTDTRSTGEDWLLQAGYSLDWNTDIRRDARRWWTARLSAEAGRYIRRDQNYAVASALAGQSFRINQADNAAIVFPHVALVAEYDSSAVRKHATGIGPGIAIRQWFRGSTHAAPRSYVDVALQYRAHLGGDERVKGWFLTTLLSF